MNMQEMARLIIALRKLGLGGDTPANFLLWVGSGEEQYEPNPMNEKY